MNGSKIEEYLIKLMYTYNEIDKNMWLIEDPENELQEVVIMYSDPLVIIRSVIMLTPDDNRLELYTKLLELNASDVIHGAYALEGNQIVLINTMNYDTMDFEEFRCTLDAFSLALTQHYPILSKFRKSI